MRRTLGASIGAIAFVALVLLGRPAVAADDPEAEDGAAASLEAARAAVLASYDFEEPVASGPDTFWAWDADVGTIDLTTAFRFSGERSLRLREVAGNRDFVEFLAYFAERTMGAVYIQFYVLFADPGEKFNFGLAGERWFLARERGGHAVWLQTAKERLLHHTASASESLASVRTFTWYFVDLVYHVDSGSYDIALWEEGRDEALVDLRGVRAFHGHDASPGSSPAERGGSSSAGRGPRGSPDVEVAAAPRSAPHADADIQSRAATRLAPANARQGPRD